MKVQKMFQTRRQKELQRLAEIQAAFKEATEKMNQMVEDSKKLQQRAFLVDIIRENGVNKFIFMRQGKLHTVDFMGTWGDDLEQWKKDLLL